MKIILEIKKITDIEKIKLTNSTLKIGDKMVT